MSNDLVSPQKAAELLGVARQTVYYWIDNDKLPYEEVKRGKGTVKRITRKNLFDIGIQLAKHKKDDKRKKEEEKPPTGDEAATTTEKTEEEPGEREIIVDGQKTLTRREAERIIKQEDAIRKQRDNLLAAGKLIDRERAHKAIEDSLSLHYSALLQLWEELLDAWAIKFNLPPDQARQMLAEFQMGLRRSWRKIKGEVEECYKT